MKNKQIMIVEDERLVARDLQCQLEDLGFDVVANCDNFLSAVEAADSIKPDLALLDVNIRGDRDGIEIGQHLRNKVGIPFIFLTAHSDDDSLRRAGEAGPSGYLIKPFDERDLQAGIEVALHKDRAEKDQQRMQKWLALSGRSLGDAVVSLDHKGRIRHLNPMAQAILGVSQAEAVGKPAPEVFKLMIGGLPVLSDFVEHAMAGETVMEVDDDIRLILREGDDFPVAFTASPDLGGADEAGGIVLVIRDCRSPDQIYRQSAQVAERLLEVRRLESLGGVAEGIAHDFNNLLAAILGNADLCADELDSPEFCRELLDEIRQATQKAANLCSRMMAVGGTAPIKRQTCDLGELLRDSLDGLASAATGQVTVSYHPTTTPVAVEGDPFALRSALQYLVENAAEAYEGKPGTVELTVSTVQLTQDELGELVGGTELQNGNYAVISVQDHGCGIAKEEQQKVFDPFFTTKFVGRGLGLSQALGITRSHHGAVGLQSAPDEGTRVTLVIPLKDGPEVDCPGDDEFDWRGEGSVLLADDSLAMRQMLAKVLAHLGFDVIVAADGEEAIRLFDDHRGDIHAVVTDYLMPLNDGLGVARHVRKSDPEMPVLVITGQVLPPVADACETGLIDGCVMKPFTTKLVGTRLRKAIERHA